MSDFPRSVGLTAGLGTCVSSNPDVGSSSIRKIFTLLPHCRQSGVVDHQRGQYASQDERATRM